MKRIITLVCLMLIISGLSAQPVITQNDMPSVGDTIWFNTAALVTGLDYEQTGDNVTWDFSSLSGTPAADTFISLSATSFTLQLAFGFGANPANLAQNTADLSFIPGLPITGITNFFRNSSSSFQMSGYGLGISIIGLPIKFNNPDVWYKFPLSINSQPDSSVANYSQSLLTLGYLKINRKRVNQVDGWGTLITPYGSFQTLRMKSVVHEEDSIYLDTIGMGVPLIRDYIEYKWMGNGHGEPLLTVTEEGPLVTWRWIDNQETVGMQELSAKDGVTVYPNPSEGSINLTYASKSEGQLSVSLWSVSGQKLMDLFRGDVYPGLNRFNFLTGNDLSPGVYFLRIEGNQQKTFHKILIGN